MVSDTHFLTFYFALHKNFEQKRFNQFTKTTTHYQVDTQGQSLSPTVCTFLEKINKLIYNSINNSIRGKNIFREVTLIPVYTKWNTAWIVYLMYTFVLLCYTLQDESGDFAFNNNAQSN